MANLLDEDKPKKMKKPFFLKSWYNKIKFGIKIIPTDKLIGGIISGFFFLFGIGHFIYYMWLLIGNYIWIILGLLIVFRPVVSLIHFLHRKWKYKREAQNKTATEKNIL